MGFDFWCNTRDINISFSGFCRILTLAGQFDWQPAGTIEMDLDEYGGGPISLEEFNAEFADKPRCNDYLVNEGQIVPPDDANALADALEQALANSDSPNVINCVDFSTQTNESYRKERDWGKQMSECHHEAYLQLRAEQPGKVFSYAEIRARMDKNGCAEFLLSSDDYERYCNSRGIPSAWIVDFIAACRAGPIRIA